MVTAADDSVVISDVTAEGSACTNATCGVRGGADAACLAYGVTLVAAGTCTVHVQIAGGGTYTDTVNVSRAGANSDCKGELQPERDVVVPSQNGGG